MKPVRLSCCLLCGRQIKYRGLAAHYRSMSHQDQGDKWWTYSRIMRLTAAYLQRQALAMVRNVITLGAAPAVLPIRSGKTINWYRYEP